MEPICFTVARAARHSFRHWQISTLLALALLLGRPIAWCAHTAAAAAEPSPAASSAVISQTPVPDDPLGRGTPRSTVEGFFGAARKGDFALAAQYLDLSGLPEGTQKQDGPSLARKLWFVLEQQARIDFSTLSIDPLGQVGDGLPPNRERLAQIEWNRGLVDIDLERVSDSPGMEIWKISSRSVGQIPELYEWFRLGFAESVFSEATMDSLMKTHVFGLSLLNWAGLATSILVWAVLIFVCLKVGKLAIAHVRPGLASNLLKTLYVPVIVICISAMVRGMIPQRLISEEIAELLRGRTIFIVVAIWILFRVADFAADQARARLLARGASAGFHLINLVRRITKVTLIVLGLSIWLDNMGFKVSTILASLGIIGLAVGLASQKFIEDLIAAMTLHATGVVKRDEAIRIGEHIGIVEDIGLRMTSIRSRDRSLITLPNAAFASMQIINYGRRDRFLYNTKIGLRYETSPDQLRFVLVELRKLLESHPKVIKETSRVRFVAFTACSLEVEIFCYIREAIFTDYLAAAEDLNLRIMDVVAQAGTGFAFPSRTMYFERGAGLNKDLSLKAEEEVRQWRQKGQLVQNEFVASPPKAPAD